CARDYNPYSGSWNGYRRFDVW
nr:immunoglobulin heavy chain junction region [Macaca mulatta]